MIFDVGAALGRRLDDPALLKALEQRIGAADIDPMRPLQHAAVENRLRSGPAAIVMSTKMV